MVDVAVVEPLTTVRGLMSADTVIGWSSDVRSVVVNAGNAVP